MFYFTTGVSRKSLKISRIPSFYYGLRTTVPEFPEPVFLAIFYLLISELKSRDEISVVLCLFSRLFVVHILSFIVRLLIRAVQLGFLKRQDFCTVIRNPVRSPVYRHCGDIRSRLPSPSKVGDVVKLLTLNFG